MTFYFLYDYLNIAPDTQDYEGGWTEVEAHNVSEALKLYQQFHPSRKGGVLPCTGVGYTEFQMSYRFKHGPNKGKTLMEEGNGGKFCHDRIRKVDGEIVREVIA